jgi:ABC-type branched-subunit amino acid transport system permease subunit
MALVGGAGTLAGPIAGAVFVGLASETLLLRFRYVYMLGLGLVLIAVVLLLPDGIAGGLRRRVTRARTP